MGKAAKIVFAFIGILVLTMGVLFFIAGVQEYFSGPSSPEIYGTIMLSVTLISLPCAGFFGYKAITKYYFDRDEYQIPDAPMKTLLYMVLTGIFALTAVTSVLVYLLYINA
ncbi:MAG: hypothetical protein CL946_04880 [Ectothiorhodospiraceae bacterium]|nr:hypothetical protein [Ectothiorhodospiraceae bacterium]